MYYDDVKIHHWYEYKVQKHKISFPLRYVCNDKLFSSVFSGSLIGAVIIVVGFYGVVWAQSKEERSSDLKTKNDGESLAEDEVDKLQSSSQKPLLESEVHV